MLKIEKAILCAFLTACIAMTASGFTVFSSQCDDIRQKVFRLHILANSDSAQDQALKLKVRDKILSVSGDLFAETGDKNTAIATVRRNLPEITEIAQQEVYSEGYSYTVKAAVVHMYFNTRTYGSVTLPAGDYDALRITIGAAKGHNWWCVLFPPLCLPGAEGQQKLDDVLGGSESTAIQTNTHFVIKFKAVELYQEARNFLSGFFHRKK